MRKIDEVMLNDPEPLLEASKVLKREVATLRANHEKLVKRLGELEQDGEVVKKDEEEEKGL